MGQMGNRSAFPAH